MQTYSPNRVQYCCSRLLCCCRRLLCCCSRLLCCCRRLLNCCSRLLCCCGKLLCCCGRLLCCCSRVCCWGRLMNCCSRLLRGERRIDTLWRERGWCHTHERVRSHVRVSHVTQMIESCRTYEWVVSHIWMSDGTWHELYWKPWQSTRVLQLDWHVSLWVTCLIMRDMSHNNSSTSIWVTCLTMSDMSHPKLNYYQLDLKYGVAKTHRMPYLHRSFSAKVPYK